MARSRSAMAFVMEQLAGPCFLLGVLPGSSCNSQLTNG